LNSDAPFRNPAFAAFLAELKAERIFAQVLLRRFENGFELRHVCDGDHDDENLRPISEIDFRKVVDFTNDGAFRPLKSAPNLQTGWRFLTRDESQLERALNTIYPGAIADWFAVKSAKTAPTNYREFTNRQTGMYRITAMLSDAQAATMIRACCHQKFCLKQRLWTVAGLEADSPVEKSLIPCLEPCAILLEFARKAMRLEQGVERNVATSENEPGEIKKIREADFDEPNNPRRIQLKIEKEKLRAT
jgi:sirohydrochlorin cobaltochelatase